MHQNNGTVHPNYRQKRRCFIASYVQPVMQQYKSKAFKITSAALMKFMDDFH